MKNTNERHRDV